MRVFMTPLLPLRRMAKLQRQVAYKYNGHNIYKYRINLPSEVVERLGWKEGTKPDFLVKEKAVEIRKKED